MMLDLYRPKTAGLEHQVKDYLAHREAEAWGIYYETGAGKSWTAVNTGGHLFTEGKITGMLIVAPKAVCGSWARPRDGHVDKHLGAPYHLHVWAGGGTKREVDELRYLLEPDPKVLKILVMSVGAFQQGRGGDGFKLALRFCLKHRDRVLLVVDEASTLKNRKSIRTKAVVGLAGHCAYRRILTGTPITQTPFDVYAYSEILTTEMFGSSYKVFESRYASYEKVYVGRDRVIDKVNGYKNLDDLHTRLMRFGTRVLKKDCLDLPEKIMMPPLIVPVDDATRRRYNRLVDECLLELGDGEEVPLANVMAQGMKLRQLASDFVITPDQLVVNYGDARLAVLLEELEESPEPTIIWTCFDNSQLRLADKLRHEYDARTVMVGKEEQAGEIEAKFQDNPDIRFLVMNTRVGGFGLTLTRATRTFYYEPDWSVELRLQTEDRTHRFGQRNPCSYQDVLTDCLIDNKIRGRTRSGIELADMVSNGTWRDLFEKV